MPTISWRQSGRTSTSNGGQDPPSNWLSRLMNIMSSSLMARYGILILLVGLICVLYFAATHHVIKPSEKEPSIKRGNVNISMNGPYEWNEVSNDQSNIGNVKQVGDPNNCTKVEGLLYDRGDGCFTYADGNNYTREGILPPPNVYVDRRIGLISTDISRCDIKKKLMNSASDNDIGVIIWTVDGSFESIDIMTQITTLHVDNSTGIMLLNELKSSYYNRNNQTIRAIRVILTPTMPSSVNSWLFAMFAIGGFLVISFMVAILIHMRLHRMRRNQREARRRQRALDEVYGMKKSTLDKDIVETFPVIIYAKKTYSGADEKEFPTLTMNSGVEEKPIDEGFLTSRILHHKTSALSNRSMRSQNAIKNASTLYSSTTSIGSGQNSPNVNNIKESILSEETIRETEITCAICIEDFENGDEIRELPCLHWYHVECIDPWLMTKSSSCPLCKHDCEPGDHNNERVVIPMDENITHGTQERELPSDSSEH